ncbi:ABC transporter permease [Herpetosiphon llansteffanensis]|uniref:ABC transporter permease n=1 Tax=Herpetosiphon llansteffanensis TaxID=2094568 RepID=UPI000D7C1547|nr:FtsX-like permease family protein [Herpetosiphon llansteffanensis]
MGLRFAFNYAWRSLRLGGQRTLLAIICIAFGVMSLGSMQSLSTAIDRSFVENRVSAGGDAALDWPDGPIGPAQQAQLEQLKQTGVIGDYVVYSAILPSMLKPAGGDHVIFSGMGYGIDPQRYPLLGELHVSEPANANMTELFKQPDAVVLSEVLAKQHDLQIGQELVMLLEQGAIPKRLKLVGLVDRVPNMNADSLFFSLETANTLDGEAALNSVRVVWGQQGAQVAALEQAGWLVSVVSSEPSETAGFFNMTLRGAGVLGLIVSGIGVANTMQVVLARRRNEIAILKTLGYRGPQLLLLFGLETALLGLIGSIFGALAAVLIGDQLTGLFERTSAFMLPSVVDWRILAGAMGLGIATTLIFGMVAIVKANAVRPGSLLRSGPIEVNPTTRRAMIGLYAGLGAMFALVASISMGSFGAGMILFVGALISLALLNWLFQGILWLVAKTPLPGYWLRLASRNMQRNGQRATFAIIALSIGVFTIGFSATALLTVKKQLDRRADPNTDPTRALWVITAPSAEQQVAATLQQLQQPALEPIRMLDITLALPDSEDGPIQAAARSREQLADLQLTEGEWQAGADEMMFETWFFSDIPLGSEFAVIGSNQKLRLVGRYDATGSQASSPLVISPAAMQQLPVKRGSSIYILNLPINQLSAVTNTVNQALPQAFVYNEIDLYNATQMLYKSLGMFAIAVASLAFVAGVVLIANAVGLALFERRREMGIFKAVGYSTSHLLRSISMEYSLIGLIAGSFGMLAVWIAITVLNTLQPKAKMGLDFLPGLLIFGCSIGLALLTALVVAWRPAHLRPLHVLREE